MRRAVLPLALFAFAALAATPAAAQLSINGAGQASRADSDAEAGFGVRVGWAHDLRDVDRRTRRARENGDITRREARSIRREGQMIRQLAGRYAAGGLSDVELHELQTRVFALRNLAGAPNRPVPPPRRGR